MLSQSTKLHRNLLLPIALLAFSLLFGGCGIFSPDDTVIDTPTEPDIPFDPAETEDQLIELLVKSWNELNDVEYVRLLDEGFVFYFAPQEVDDIGQGASWDRARDVQSADNMFNSQPGTRPNGDPQEPVQTIALELIAQGSGWTSQVPDEFAGTVGRTFEVEMSVTYTNGDISEVSGLQEFYLVPAEEVVDDITVQVWRLKFWRDLGRDEV